MEEVLASTIERGEYLRTRLLGSAQERLLLVREFRLELGRVCIGESACPSQDCVHTGWISRAGEQIICLPNRLVISLTGGQQEFDAVTG